jgi:hypothetical protein
MDYKYWLRNEYFMSALILLILLLIIVFVPALSRIIRHHLDMTSTSKHTPAGSGFSVRVPKSWNIGERDASHLSMFAFHLISGRDEGFDGKACFSAWAYRPLRYGKYPEPRHVLMTVFKKKLPTGSKPSAQDLANGLVSRLESRGYKDTGMVKSEVKTVNGHQWVKTSVSADTRILSFSFIYWQTVDSWSNHYVIAFYNDTRTSELVFDNIVKSFTFLGR